MNREEYRSEKGVAAWWQKDGAWHIALPESGREGFFWTDTEYPDRDSAVAAIDKTA